MRVAKAIDHANVIPLFDSGAIDGTLYTCSQLVPGRDILAISDRLAIRGLGAPAAVGVRILLDALSALVRIQGVLVHGALGPRNVIVGWDGIARISDLGVPRAKEVNDLQALGFVLHRLYTGQTGTAGIAELRPDLPDWVQALVFHLIQGTGDAPSLIFSAILKRAVEDGLMIPHSAIASWVAELFPIERAIELGEVASAAPFVVEDTAFAATLVRPREPGFLDAGHIPRGWVRPPSKTEPEVTAWDSRTRYARPLKKVTGGVAC